MKPTNTRRGLKGKLTHFQSDHMLSSIEVQRSSSLFMKTHCSNLLNHHPLTGSSERALDQEVALADGPSSCCCKELSTDAYQTCLQWSCCSASFLWTTQKNQFHNDHTFTQSGWALLEERRLMSQQRPGGKLSQTLKTSDQKLGLWELNTFGRSPWRHQQELITDSVPRRLQTWRFYYKIKEKNLIIFTPINDPKCREEE